MSEWQEISIKSFIKSTNGGVWGLEKGEDEVDVRCLRVADFDRSNNKTQANNSTIRSYKASQIDGKMLQKGDLLIEKSGGGEQSPVGNVVLYDLNEPAMYSNFVARLCLKNSVHPEFALYTFANLYNQKINTRSIRQTTGIQNLNLSSYLNEKVMLPDLATQQRIAAFLDSETSKIDALSDELTKFKANLQLQKRGLVSECVTKGIPSERDRVCKDSGVEWLGDIPVGWNISKIKSIAKIFGRIGFRGYTVDDIVDEGEGALVIGPSNIGDNILKFDKKQYISWKKYEESPEIKIYNNDVIFVKTASVGKTAIIEGLNEPATLNPQAIVFKNIKIIPKYLYYSLISNYLKYQITTSTNKGVVDNISQAKINDYKLLIPHIDEQQRIADYLDTETAKIDALIGEIDNQVNLLKTYRKSLINEVVTGKVEV